MKRSTRRVIALLLALLMMVTTSVSAFASGYIIPRNIKVQAYNGKSYSTYTQLGDSVAVGFSLPDYKRNVRKQRVEGTYGAIVADKVHAKKYYAYAQDGFRSAEIRMLLDNSYNGDELTDTEVKDATEGRTTKATLKAQRKQYQSAVKASDLITLDCGFNDIWLKIVGASHEEIYKWPISYTEAFMTMLTDYNENYTACVKSIVKMNPKATVVLVGTYNPCEHWDLPPYSGLYWGKFLDLLYLQMNNVKKDLANQYKNVIYVDVPDTEVFTEHTPLLIGGFDPHPTVDGHKYMANQILSGLEAKK